MPRPLDKAVTQLHALHHAHLAGRNKKALTRFEAIWQIDTARLPRGAPGCRDAGRPGAQRSRAVSGVRGADKRATPSRG